MSSRQTRTHDRLRTAIYQLAAERPLDEITVADVSRLAGISRDTFYRWTPSPVDCLARMLGEELDVIVAANADLPVMSGTTDSVFETGVRDLLEFIARHKRIYCNAMHPRMHAVLRDGLTARIEANLTQRLSSHPEIAPDVNGGRPDQLAKQMFVSYAAAGAVGAIETWLTARYLEDITVVERILFASAANWWLGRSQIAN